MGDCVRLMGKRELSETALRSLPPFMAEVFWDLVFEGPGVVELSVIVNSRQVESALGSIRDRESSSC